MIKLLLKQHNSQKLSEDIQIDDVIHIYTYVKNRYNVNKNARNMRHFYYMTYVHVPCILWSL